MTLSKTALLPAALVSSGLLAVFATDVRSEDPTPTSVQPEPAQAAPPSPAPMPPTPMPAAGLTLRGKVIEKIDVDQYSYLRLALQGGASTWTAVPRSELTVGQEVTLRDAQEMRDFRSSTLQRTFPTIYFGALESGTTAHGSQQPAGARISPLASSSGEPPPGAASPHSPPAPPQEVPFGAVQKATGPNGHTVATLHEERERLAGATVRVRGTIVKSISGVMGRTFAHLRDGSGGHDAATDLTVTTTAELVPGTQVLLEGTLAIDRDFGAGYRYPVILEDAQVLDE